jgi:glycosyltransferase involved in cell wall biosynthesis
MLQTVDLAENGVAVQQGIAWHMITCEYPPQSGGVSDYTYLLAKGLASRGDEVHVWCPAWPVQAPLVRGVQIHSALGRFSPADLWAAGRELDRFPAPRRLLVQWVPHGFGYKSLNLAFCLWLWHRSARHGDRVDVIVHEPFLPFVAGNWRQNAAALVHRLMTLILLRTAQQLWVSTPSWEKLLRPYECGRHHNFDWLPVPSNVPTVADPAAIHAIRSEYAPGGLLAGHFGTFGPAITPMLRAAIPAILRTAPSASLLLIGRGSNAFREDLVREAPDLKSVIHATGAIDEPDRLSLHLSACDVLVQPYPDGVTTRRSTIMAALSHGRPTITTIGALTEPLWTSSGAVALAPAEDIEEFVRSVLRLLEDREQRASLGDAGRQFYQLKFDIAHVVQRLHSYD